MNLLITGTRAGRPDVEWYLERFVQKHGNPELVILGCARGVDCQAWTWVMRRGLKHHVHRANWKEEGKLAGHLRNQRMVDMANAGDWCLAFPHAEKSPGTWDCVERAKQAGLQIAICKLRVAA